MKNTDTASVTKLSADAQHSLLQECKLHADNYLKEHLKEVLDKSDSTLFEYSDKAGGVGGGNDYFDAMRDLRRQRQELIQCFFDSYTREYTHRLEVGGKAPDTDEKSITCLQGPLSLIETHDLEESLAIEAAVVKARDRFHNEIYALTQRYNLLLVGTKLEEDYHPLGPDVLGHAFRDVFRTGAYTVKVKLIIYKLFDQLVMRDLKTLYTQLNTRLASAGVLAQLKPMALVRNVANAASPAPPESVTNEVSPDATPTAPASSATTTLPGIPASGAAATAMTSSSLLGTATEDTYQVLQNLMNLKKYGDGLGNGMGMPIHQAESVGAPGTARIVYTAMPMDELLQGLTQLQQTGLPPETVDGTAVMHIKNLLLTQSDEQKGTNRAIHPMHDNIIDVIGMIFEFIFDETSIPDTVKSLLGELQIPILKVAIADREFFTEKLHPARRLLNVLGHASIGWDKHETEFKERHYAKMEYIVGRALREYKTESSLFAELLADFTAFLAAEAESNLEEPLPLDEIEQEEPEGRQAFETVETRLELVEIPTLLRDFLRGNWRLVLERTLEDDGHDSEIWHLREKAVDDLIWSVQPKTGHEERRLMATILPPLLATLRDGMSFIGSPQLEIDTIIDGFQPIHMACLRGEYLGEDTSHVMPPATSLSAEMWAVHSTTNGHDNGGEMWEKSSGLSAFEAELLGITQPAPDDFTYSASAPIMEDEFTTLARNLDLGVWLEFEHGDKKRRAKLAWKSAVLEQYVFVDRKYKIVEERTLLELADDFREGRATAAEELPMFDRALDKVLNSLMSAVSKH